jgi:hypothetical protein
MHFVRKKDMQSWIVLLCLFHIKISIARHVELQNVAIALMDQPQEHELGIPILQNILKGMEFGG